MSTHSQATSAPRTRPSPAPQAAAVDAPFGRTGGARARLIAGALALSTLGAAALGWWHPDPDSNDEFTYAVVEPIREAWWAWHLFGGIVLAVSAIAAGLAVCLLVRDRGAGWATGGAVLAALGGLTFSAGIAAEGVLFAYVTDPDALPVETGQSLMTYLNDNPERYLAAILPGIVLLTLGSLLLAVGLWRAASVPRWLPVTFGAVNLVSFVVPFGVLSDLTNIVLSATLLAIAWFLWQQTASTDATGAQTSPPARASRSSSEEKV